jgi:ribosomal protein S18 acetylase RimI-like enzyme
MLRPFLQIDLASAFALDQVCFAEGIAYSRAELRYFVLRANAYAVVAEKTGRMAGFLVASHSSRQPNRVAHIVTLDVDPAVRRMGVASLLMDDAEQHYRALGCEGLQLEVAVDNEAAKQFYRQQGFVPTGFLRGYYNGRLDAVTMKKLFLSA